MVTVETVPFDAAEYLTSLQAQTELISEAFASGDTAFIAHALDTVARARGGQSDSGKVAAIAKAANISGPPADLKGLYARARELGFSPSLQPGISGALAK